MCGICGIVTTDDHSIPDSDVLHNMMKAMRHRGPDEDGHYIDEKAALGSRRLSIIDLKGGRQPITNETEQMWIVFNGEIYNYRELRQYLIKREHVFRTMTDTEVILHLYEEFGSDCLRHLNGIFAFAIWDKQNRRLILARDRIGVKPLYYAFVGGLLIFGSEMKVLFKYPDLKRDIDLISLNEYLSYEYVPTPRTILRDVHRLPAGHSLRFDAKGVQIEPYWDISLARSESRPPVHWRDYAVALSERLRTSIHREMVSDVPVGVLLSGGIDSSTVAKFMTDSGCGKVESFCIGFESDTFDESEYARLVARYLGTEHNELILTSRMASEIVPKICEVLDEPFGDSSFIPTYLLSMFARQKVKVVLGGDGSDELFAGYPTLIAHRLIEYYEHAVPWTIRSHLVPWMLDKMSVSFDNISLDFRVRRFMTGRGVPLQARHHRWLGSFLDEEKYMLLRDWIRPVLSHSYAQAYAHASDCDARLPINKILYDDMKMYLEGDILYKVDRASMAASLEVRVPLLNNEVVQFVNDLPADLKLHRLTGKYLLKKAMQAHLPKKILKRRKKGFNMPVAYWLAGDLRQLLLDMLSEKLVNDQGFFNYGYIKQLLDDHFARRADNRKLLWTLLMFQLWYFTYIDAQ